MLKLQRNYRIEFERGDKIDFSTYIPKENIEVKYPITLELNVTRDTFADLNKANFRLYNLAPETQAKLWKDLFDLDRYVRMKLYAGYGEDLSLIFYGEFTQCYSYRQSGSTDFITEIEANDLTLLLLNSFTNKTVSKGTDGVTLIQSLLAEIPEINAGYISPTLPVTKSNQTFLGSTINLLRREFSDYQIYVNNNQLNIIGQNEVIPGEVTLISAETGLLGTPTRADAYLQAEMIFEPKLEVSQAVVLLSETEKSLNNTYKVVALSHAGIISPVVSGTLKTTATFTMGNRIYEKLKKTNPTYGKEPTPGSWLKPVRGTVTSSFGYRVAPTAGASTYHKGIDIGANRGDTIVASASGKVIQSGWNGGLGISVMIQHSNNLVSIYGHMERTVAKNGEIIPAGQIIGYVGSTGYSTGPHLHFQINKNGKAVNPLEYIGSF